jgi:two-component system sensor histidine kinase PhoQ
MRLRLPGSLAGRLLAASSLLIVVFLSVTAVALDHAFRDSSEGATQDLLRSRVLGLLAAADVGDAGGVVMRGDLPEERFFRPGSGLYARFIAAGGREAWSSPSLVSGGFPPGEPVEPGEAVYDRVIGAGDEALARLRFGVAWEIGPGEPAVYTVSVAESLDAYFEDLSRFRREIGAWFAGLGLALLAVQWWLLSFLLRPVRQAESEIGEMEQGRRESLSEGYPKELEALTSRLNALVASERSRAARYRSTLDDLAHSLKTPLAVLRTLVRAGPEGLAIGDLGARSGVTGSTLTHHLKILSAAGLLSQIKDGRRIICIGADYTQMQEISTFLLKECCADTPDKGRTHSHG